MRNKETEEMTKLVTKVGQEETAEEGVFAPPDGDETDVNLKNGNEKKDFQNLETPDFTVAPELVSDGPYDGALDEILKASAEEGGESVIAEIEAPTVEEPEQTVADNESENAELGLQSDGSYKIIVTIPEGYWGAIKEWAESDGLPTDRWISDRLCEYIYGYGERPKAK
jgi:hypothetical protein